LKRTQVDGRNHGTDRAWDRTKTTEVQRAFIGTIATGSARDYRVRQIEQALTKKLIQDIAELPGRLMAGAN
jgi:hypothetical protein